MWIPSDLENQN